MGIRVQLIRYCYVTAGAALIGLAGADMVLAYAPTWNEGLTAGRGWIAVGLVIFARWNPLRALFCAYFFGALDSLGFRIQLLGSAVPSYFLKNDSLRRNHSRIDVSGIPQPQQALRYAGIAGNTLYPRTAVLGRKGAGGNIQIRGMEAGL
ncbi:hypothetical protein ACFSQ7_41605 [Paenibacillus rhizoplanae]